MKTIIRAASVVFIVAIAAGGAFAKGPPAAEAGNNLSQPAKFLAGGDTAAPAVRVPCAAYPDVTDQAPGADGTLPTLEANGLYYWLQKTASVWTAECSSAVDSLVYGSPVEVRGDWGDNLTGGGVLKAGKPIRVEMGLFEVTSADAADFDVLGTGYPITNITPDLADRLATYGVQCTADCTTTDLAPVPAVNTGTPYRVFDGTARLNIVRTEPTPATIFDGPMTAEINSTGGVVYGYNWGTSGRVNAPTAGTYVITFTIANDNSHMGSVVDGALCTDSNATTGGCATVTIVLTGGGRGGRGG